MPEPLTVTVRVTMSVPRLLTATWPAGLAAGQTFLVTQGLMPVTAEHVRWRVDPIGQGYIVEYEVPVQLPGEEG